MADKLISKIGSSQNSNNGIRIDKTIRVMAICKGDNTSHTWTIPSNADFIICTSNVITDYGAELVTSISGTGNDYGFLTRIGDSVTITRSIRSTGAVQNITSSFTWSSENSLELSRSGTDGGVEAYICKYE